MVARTPGNRCPSRCRFDDTRPRHLERVRGASEGGNEWLRHSVSAHSQARWALRSGTQHLAQAQGHNRHRARPLSAPTRLHEHLDTPASGMAVSTAGRMPGALARAIPGHEVGRPEPRKLDRWRGLSIEIQASRVIEKLPVTIFKK